MTTKELQSLADLLSRFIFNYGKSITNKDGKLEANEIDCEQVFNRIGELIQEEQRKENN